MRLIACDGADLADAALVGRVAGLLEAAIKPGSEGLKKRQAWRAYEKVCIGLEIAAYPIDNAREALFLLELCPASSATDWSYLSGGTVKAWRSHLKFLRTALAALFPQHGAVINANDGTIPHALMSRPRLSGARVQLVVAEAPDPQAAKSKRKADDMPTKSTSKKRKHGVTGPALHADDVDLALQAIVETGLLLCDAFMSLEQAVEPAAAPELSNCATVDDTLRMLRHMCDLDG